MKSDHVGDGGSTAKVQVEPTEPMSTKLFALAAVYRSMPYGGALLSISQGQGDRHFWLVGDGVTVKAEFETAHAAVAALQAAGFYEAQPNRWKLRFTLPCGCRIDDQILCTHGYSQLA